ncbi:MAG: hypothetical protein AAGJ96_06620, partial [Pseudomonadota bacterium]
MTTRSTGTARGRPISPPESWAARRSSTTFIVVAIATEVTEEAAPETDALPRPKPRPEWDVEILLTRAEAPLEPVEVVANERDV